MANLEHLGNGRFNILIKFSQRFNEFDFVYFFEKYLNKPVIIRIYFSETYRK